MIRSILVPLDGSRFGEQALPYALTIARRAGARVELIHVHTPLEDAYAEMPILNTTLGERVREEARHYLRSLGQDLNAQTQLRVTTAFKEGPVPKTIRDHVEEQGFDLVVLTTHARGAFGRFWLGSIADTLVREVRAPLLLVPPAERPLPRLGQFAPEQVLIPLDGSPLAEEILPAALSLGRLFGASYTLLRVIQPLLSVPPIPLGSPGSFAEVARAEAQAVEKIHEELRVQAKEYLDTLAAPLQQEGLSVRTLVATEDQPAQGILNRSGVDLIAMATHGRRGLNRFFRGSVADKVLRGSPVPVLVQRPRKLSA
jgi:nucleotide-binding universal stress UspA family protein